MNVFEVTTKSRRFDQAAGKMKTRTIVTEVSFPSSVEEITLKMWSDYFISKETDPEWVRELEKMTPQNQLERMGGWSNKEWAAYYELVLKYLACFTASDTAVLADAPLMDGDSLMAIYFQIIGIIHSYEPTAREWFEFKGDKYVVDTVETDRFGRVHYGKNFTANQVIDALQYEHIFNVKGEDGKFAIPDRKYQIDLALLALLTRKVQPDDSLEERPLEYLARQNWTEEKIKHFMDVPMDIALDVDFFLRSLKMNFLLTHTQGRFFGRGKLRPTQKP